ncbi:uncharacterized protein STEHIDRAFT_60549 [Stereum hirsutum FP-91666 SS1]|uniref:uncharacterized protein n=1 Tax=Stereum hirsutum (strain FP-91666) TaxID=721885 RepID=UPI0004449266|nr:uncharacterized protein STEHIDRAFT_60549 [Stereum hirsutum FP-91666 SS1]EIM84685.1 hypothetical protein STEHIDRAFT_60549 [Stereum hirsutum FP-91666 SS1]
MGKNNKNKVQESDLVLPPHSSQSSTPIIDTHTHLVSTFSAYQAKFKGGKHTTVHEFVRRVYDAEAGEIVEAIIDVWCEAPVQKKIWKEIADSALTEEQRKREWGGIEYWFVMGAHEAKVYTDEVEADILEAMAHPRCVGWGEMGLDYHYDNSPREIQQAVFRRQLRQAVRLGKPLTIHTREAEEDTEMILKEEVPQDHRIHIHCYTDSPELAQRLLDHFPNLYVGITGVITYSTNLNTAALVRQLTSQDPNPRLILETDAPYMIPSNLYGSLKGVKGRLPLSHTAMIPWTAEFVAGVANGVGVDGKEEGTEWDTDRVLKLCRENAKKMYGV